MAKQIEKPSKLEKIAKGATWGFAAGIILSISFMGYNAFETLKTRDNKEVSVQYANNMLTSVKYGFGFAMLSMISAGYLAINDISRQKRENINYQI